MPARKKASKTTKNSSANLGFEAKLWLAADKLRNNMDAAKHKHVVLGLIFLEYTPVILRPKEITDALTKEVKPTYDRFTSILEGSRTLATLRDTLLPKLLSGELAINGLNTAVL